jgi:type I restriction enzyme S subunit
MPLSQIVSRVSERNGEHIDRVLTVSAHHGLVQQESFFTKRVAAKNLTGYLVVRPGTFVYNKSYSAAAPFGVVTYNKSTKPGVVSPLYFTFRPNSDLVLEEYLEYVLNSNTFHQQMARYVKEGGRAHGGINVSVNDYLSVEVPLPTLLEQRRVVDLVSSVDSYIAALQQQADAAHAARSAVLSELLSAGGDDWIETTLGETLEIARGGSPRPIRDFITSEESGVNWVKIGDASASSKYIYRTEQKIRQDGVSRSRPVKVGDFILSNSMSFGRPYIMRTDGCIHDGWLLFSKVEDHFDEDFLYNLLMSDSVQTQFDSLAAGSGVRNLNIEVVGEVRISLPPLDLQREIAEVANSLDAYVLAIEQSIVDSTRLRVGLLTDLLSGEHEIPESYDRLLGAA